MRTFLSVVILASSLTLMARHISLQPQPLSYKNQNQKPIQIVKLTPSEDARLTNSKLTVVVSFDFTRGSKPIRAFGLRLLIDGVNVTKQSEIISTADIPTSYSEIRFKPSRPFSATKHTAEVQLIDDQNKLQHSYTWDFYVLKK